MILSIDSNDANTAPLHKKTISSLSGAVESIMKKLEDVGVLVARILMPILFITAGWGKITGYAGTQQYMEAMGVPGFMLPLVILLAVSYTHLTLPTKYNSCRSRWSPYH